MFEVSIHGADGRVLKRLELYGTRPLRLGRSKECDIRLPIAAVSRQHAELAPLDDEGSAWVIRDLGSTHGCVVQGHRVRELTIRPGLEVRLGPAVLRFESLASRIGAELDDLLEDGEEGDDDVTEIRIVGNFRRSEPMDETLT